MKVGSRIGPYEVVALVGQGGMGEVYRATDTNLKRTVALKVLPEAVAADSDRLARFQREAEVLARLNHPNIAQIHGFEKSDAPGLASVRALVMEFVEGPTLADRLAQGPIPIQHALPIAREIAAALEAAHEQGIVHRDLKPANIKVRVDGTVKVLDFGLAKAFDQAGSVSVAFGTGQSAADNPAASPTITSPAMTQAGIIFGTAPYMSPEQARGSDVDKRTDVWAFGAVLFEMLTGRRAFGGDDVSEVIASVLAREPEWSRLPADVPPAIVAFIKRCLQRDRKQRVRDIGDVALALDGAFDIGVDQGSHPDVQPRPRWRRAVPIALATILAVIVTSLAAWIRWPAIEPRSITRFEHVLPEGRTLMTTQRPVLAMSPDGRSFVYLGSDGLMLRSLDELEPRLIPGSQIASSPFFSPDGESIAYFTTTGVLSRGNLTKISLRGGAPIVLCEASSPFGASWSPDGTILFGQSAGIMRVSGNGGTPELLVPANGGEQFYGPQLLPGGRAVMFSVTEDTGPSRWDRAHIIAQSLDTSQRTMIVEGGTEARYVPSGHLVYSARGRLMAIAFDPLRFTVRGSPVPIVQDVQFPVGVAAAGSNYGIANDGTLVYLARNPALRSLIWMHRDGTSRAIDTIPAAAYEDVRLSPDGARVLVTRDGDIWIYDLASGRNSRVTRDGSSQMGVWDPTGSRIAYSSAQGGNLEAWVTPADGSGQPRQLTRLGGTVHVDSWSPDGRIVTFHHHRADLAVPILTLAIDRPDAKPEVFLEGPFSAEGAHFSRDGRHVVFLSAETRRREIYIRPYPGPGGQVTVSVEGGMEPIWAGNGDVFYRSLDGTRMFVASMTTTPKLIVGTPVQLFEGRHYIAPTGSPRAQYDVTSDGQRLLMLTNATASSVRPRIVIVQNWLEELKRLVPLK